MIQVDPIVAIGHDVVVDCCIRAPRVAVDPSKGDAGGAVDEGVAKDPKVTRRKDPQTTTAVGEHAVRDGHVVGPLRPYPEIIVQERAIDI